MRLLLWIALIAGYLLLPRYWGGGWVMVGSAPVVTLGEDEPARWTLYIVNIHNHTRVASVVVRFPDGRAFVAATEPPDTTSSLWSLPSVRTVTLTLPPEAWAGLPEGPHKITLEIGLVWPRARGMPWAYRFEQVQGVRTWQQTLNVVKY